MEIGEIGFTILKRLREVQSSGEQEQISPLSRCFINYLKLRAAGLIDPLSEFPPPNNPELIHITVGTSKRGSERFFLMVGAELICLNNQPGALYAYMLANPNRVLSREELGQVLTLQPGVNASRSLVDTNVCRLRKIINSYPGNQHIVTIKKAGYEFKT